MNNILNACLALALFVCFSAPVKAQNLVPDPSFEHVTEDTTHAYDVIKPLKWKQANGLVSVCRKQYPENHHNFNYTEARTGRYFLTFFDEPEQPTESQNRLIWIKLNGKTQPGTDYTLSLFISAVCHSVFNDHYKISCPTIFFTDLVTFYLLEDIDDISSLIKIQRPSKLTKENHQKVRLRKGIQFDSFQSKLEWIGVRDTFTATCNAEYLVIYSKDIADLYESIHIDDIAIEELDLSKPSVQLNLETDSSNAISDENNQKEIPLQIINKHQMMLDFEKADSLLSAEKHQEAKDIYSDLLKKSAIPDSNDQNLDMIEGNTLYNLARCNTKLDLPFESVTMYISQAIDSGYYANMELFHDYKTFGEFTSRPEWFELLQKNSLGQCKKYPKINCKIYTEMTNMYFRDQLIRNKFIACENDSIKKAELLLEMKTIDSLNLLRLIPILDKYGYPGEKLMGSTASHYGIFILIHSDRETMAKYIGLVDKAFKKDDVNGMMVCMLINRMMLLNDREALFNKSDTPPKKAKHLRKALKRIGIEEWEKYQEFYF